MRIPCQQKMVYLSDMKNNTAGMSKLARVMVVALLGLIASAKFSHATSFMLSDYNGTLFVSTGTAVTTVSELSFGYFTGGFTPTTGNFSQWMANFVGVSGYVDGSSPEWSAAIDIANNLTYPVDTQLYVIAYNILDSASTTTATEAAILTNTAWKIIAASGTDLVPNFFDFDGKFNGYDVNSGAEISRVTGTLSMVVGTLSGSQVTMAVIPEPAVAQTLVLGGMMCLTLRRRLKKVLRS